MTVRNIISPRRVPRVLFHTREQVAYTPNYYLVMSRATQVASLAPAPAPTEWTYTVGAGASTLTITFSAPMVVNAAMRTLELYSVTPDNDGAWPQDARESLRVLAVDTGADDGDSTTEVVLTVEEMLEGAHYDLDIITWRVA